MSSIAVCQNYLDITKIIVAILSTITLTTVAIMGLFTWKTQLKGKTEYDLARRLLRAIYKTRDAIDTIRSPFASASEISTSLEEAEIDIDHFDSDYHIKSQTSLYQRRWRYVSEAMRDLDLESFEAEVLWHDEIREKIVAFRR